MNRLTLDRQCMALSMLVEGSSMRSISRVTGVSFNTIRDLMIRAGKACVEHHNAVVRDVTPRSVQCDEIWAFCYAKAKNVSKAKAAPIEAGDIWTWTALDEDSKLMVSYLMGDRSTESAVAFFDDLKYRLAPNHRPRIISDGLPSYPEALGMVFEKGEIDYQQKIDGNDIKNNYVERNNLNIRMGLRRYTRKTNGYSKKLENMYWALSLYFAYANFVRVHMTLDTTPAVAAGLADEPYTMEWIAGMVNEAWAKPNRPKTYKTKEAA